MSVAVTGDTVIVSAPGEDSSATGVNGNQSDNGAQDSGAAYVFVRSGTNWSQQAYLKASNTGPPDPLGFNDNFGFSLAVSADTVVVGAYSEDSNATGVNGDGGNDLVTSSGAAYVFVRNGTNWTHQAYLKASNTGPGDFFGFSVAVSGDPVAVGAVEEFSNATGVNGNQSDNSAPGAGTAYVFLRSGTNWNQQAYLKASNTRGGNYFGHSVAASGDTVVTGAYGERSNGTGVNSDQADTSAWFSGAAYVFAGVAVGPRLSLLPDGGGGYFLRLSGASDFTYRLQRASSITGPWDTHATLTAPASGLLEFHDTPAPPGQAFYRTVQP